MKDECMDKRIEKIQCAIDKGFKNPNLDKGDIVSIFQLVREAFLLDSVFLASNMEYQYQLSCIVYCEDMDDCLEIDHSLMLTFEEYNQLVSFFGENPVYDKEIDILNEGFKGYALRGAIMQGSHYYGHIAFASKCKRVWGETEKEIMTSLTHLLRIYFGMKCLDYGVNRFEFAYQKMLDDSISSGFFLDIKSGKCHALKRAPFLRNVKEWEDYQALIDEYTGKYVDPIYGKKLRENCNVEALKKHLSLKRPVFAIDFPRVVDEKVNWYSYVAELADCDENGRLSKAYFHFDDITKEMQKNAYISSVSEMNRNAYTIISAIDLDTQQYAVYVDNRDESVKNGEYMVYGGYSELIEKMSLLSIDKEYADEFKSIFSLEHLKEHFANSREMLRYVFPYRLNEDKVFWVKMEAVKTQHYSDNGKKIVLYFSNITEEKNKELELMTVSENLEKEHEKVLKAEQKVMIDPLTGIYNRNGYDAAIKQYSKENVPIGFVLVDVDNFKSINDNFGHEFGDVVLQMVAKRLEMSFRNKDKVFRLGGDEFALLLYNCDIDIWSSLQMKLSGIHHYLKEYIKKNISVTLSVGFSVSDCGFNNELMSLADEALYHTKSVGRAGLTQISRDRKILNSWKDSAISDAKENVLQTAVLGNWRVEYSDDKDRTPRLFMDETLHIMLEIPNILTPEECYRFWFDRIVERHRELYHEMKDKLINSGQAQCSYQWVHPSKGEILISAGAKYREKGQEKEFFGYMQEMKASDVVLSYDDGQFIMQAMNRIYFCTYYFDINSRDYYIVKGHEDEKDVKLKHHNIDKTFEEFVKGFVHPDDQKQVADFANLDTLSERLKDKTFISCEYQSMSKAGWCRTIIMPVKWDEKGKVTHAVSMSASIDAAQNAELERENDINRKISSALNSIYFASHIVELATGKYTILQGTDYSIKMLEGCTHVSQAFEKYIECLVKPEFADKMRTFCQTDTIALRLKGEKRIDCEYISSVIHDWCRASFIPVNYDENGRVTHVLFVVSHVDSVKAKEIEEGILGKKNLAAIFDKVPGGIVLYKWNGQELETLNISKYYKDQYGDSLDNNGKPDFLRIHPDDMPAYKAALFAAITKSENLEYVYRVWDRKHDKYVWSQINAVAEDQGDGTALVYAMYTDVTKQKEAELLLAKRTASLVSVLKASNQLCYEYDPKTHIEECLTEDEIFKLPRVIEDYPKSMLPIVHPDDHKTFLDTIYSMEDGRKDAACNIRLKVGDKYMWYAYRLHAMYDTEKERIVVLLSIKDNSEHIAVLQDYKYRMQALMGARANSLTLASVNITNNSFGVVLTTEAITRIAEKSQTLDDMYINLSHFVMGERQQQEYRKLFNCKSLLAMAQNGHMNVKMDHVFKVSENHIECVRTCVDMLHDPVTGDITGVCYARSIQEETIKDVLLEKIIQTDYPVIAIIQEETGEFYLFEYAKGYYCMPMKDYWKAASEHVPEYAHSTQYEEFKKFLHKDTVLLHLSKNNEYVHTFNITNAGKEERIEFRYNYVDRTNGLIMLSIRDVTDKALLLQYKFDSEHDPLTGLLNRKSVFEKCKLLIEQHPDDEFIMLHGDLKNFHLFNAFFGEEAGDQLLCDVAERFKVMDKDYEYWAYGRIEADVFCAFFPWKPEILEKHLRYIMEDIPKTHNDFLIEPNIGIYKVSDATMPIEAMFTRATIAAKTGQKNFLGSLSLFDEAMEKYFEDNQEIIKEMKNAIETQQFEVYLQPKYSLQTHKIVGSEALVRWMHPTKGMVPPGRFISIFEGNGFIVELDHYMWEHVCMILRRWLDEGREVHPISVNVSRVSMYSQGTVAHLMNLVEKYDIDPKYLELELTETAYMDDPKEIKLQLGKLQEFGFSILMDDFGSGYSSLNTLRELPVDILKLDMKFLSETSKDLRGNIVLSSVISMSKNLGLPIIAEGIETKEQADYIAKLGCEYAQGFLFARPMPVAEYEKRLEAESDS